MQFPVIKNQELKQHDDRILGTRLAANTQLHKAIKFESNMTSYLNRNKLNKPIKDYTALLVHKPISDYSSTMNAMKSMKSKGK
jgi:hypothetical protein